MPQLQEDAPALGVHRFGDASPALHLFRCVDARRGRHALATGHYLGCFGDDQASCTGTLAIVGSVQRVGHIAGSGCAHAGERRHHDAMAQRVGTQAKGLKQGLR